MGRYRYRPRWSRFRYIPLIHWMIDRSGSNTEHPRFFTAAAAAHLAERGSKILGIDRFQEAHANGSSHGRSRIIRLAYYEDHRCKLLPA